MFRPAPLLAMCPVAVQRRVADYLNQGIVLHEQMHENAPGPRELWLEEQTLMRLYAIRDRLVGPPETPRKQ